MKPADSFLSQLPLSFKRLLSAKQIPVIKISGILFVLLSLFPYGSVRADRIIYSYDSGGNRINRQKEIIYGPRGEVQDSAHQNPSYRDALSMVNITIRPNPTDGDLTIEITGTDDFQGSTITIYGMNGGILYYTDAVSYSNEIDLRTWADGVYLLVIRNGGESSSWKIVKKS